MIFLRNKDIYVWFLVACSLRNLSLVGAGSTSLHSLTIKGPFQGQKDHALTSSMPFCFVAPKVSEIKRISLLTPPDSRMRSTSQSSNDDAGANAGNGGLRERSDTVEKKEKHARFSVQATTQEQDPALSSGGDDSATTAEIDTSPSSPEPPGVATDTDNDETHQKTHGSQTTHWTYMNKSLRWRIHFLNISFYQIDNLYSNPSPKSSSP